MVSYNLPHFGKLNALIVMEIWDNINLNFLTITFTILEPTN